MTRYIFHLAIPVSDLAAARQFYLNVLGAKVGRENSRWLDVLLWGHQITLHLAPEEVRAPSEQGHRHFGVVLPWAEWETLAAWLGSSGVEFMKPPEVLYAGQYNEQAKLYLRDPGNNVIEIKAYRSFADTFGKAAENWGHS